MIRFTAGAAFWIIVLVGLVPLFVFRYRSLTLPDKAFVAWDRNVIWVRLVEWADIFLYLAVVYHWDWDFPLTRYPRAAAAAGLFVTLPGVAVTAWSKIALGEWFSTTLGVKPGHQVITRGPYRFVRHPMYSGLLLVLLGGALVYNSGAVLVLLFAPFCAMFYWQSIIEERLLAAHLGEGYSQYRAATGRLLPRLLR